MSSLSIEKFLDIFEETRGYKPYFAQKEAIASETPATWVLAGPGTGKSEVLVVRTLRLLLVDKVAPESIVLTTFTNRAADNLLERLNAYLEELLNHPRLKDAERPNLSGIWLGTLHSIAYDMLRQFDVKSERIIMLDEAASTFRLLRQSDIIDNTLYQELNGSPPANWVAYNRIHHAEKLKLSMNRIVEDHLDAERLESNNPARGELSMWTNEQLRLKYLHIHANYIKQLGESVDFSIVQGTFYEFLTSSRSDILLNEDTERSWPGIKHIIVDEYQDTNPIQEAIYFALSKNGATLTVVGDDDQSLYRFRGASVDAMIGFAKRCVQLHPKVDSESDVLTVILDENRRSHPMIVDTINRYIEALKSQKYDQARAPKPDLLAKSGLEGEHSAFFVLIGESELEISSSVARITLDLRKEGRIEDYRQVALLSQSTKETSKSLFRHYPTAFRNQGVPMFNPGAKILNKDPALREVIGLICMIIDSNGDVLDVMGKDLKKMVNRYLSYAKGRLSKDEDLAIKIKSLITDFHHPQRERGDSIPEGYPSSWNLLRLFYSIINLPTYSWLLAEEGGPNIAQSTWRLGWMTQLMKSFQNSQTGDSRLSHVTSDCDDFYIYRSKRVPAPMHGVNPWIVDRIYRDLIAILDAGGFNEIEDDIQGIPNDMSPALTIHQSKGLEFPIVFICAQKGAWGPSAEHYQEDFFHPFRYNPMHTHGHFTAHERAIHDDIRRLFVGMSRAQYACGLCLPKNVYDGILNGDSSIVNQYSHIPAAWLKTLPVVKS